MTDKAKKPSQFVELQINKESVTHQDAHFKISYEMLPLRK